MQAGQHTATPSFQAQLVHSWDQLCRPLQVQGFLVLFNDHFLSAHCTHHTYDVPGPHLSLADRVQDTVGQMDYFETQDSLHTLAQFNLDRRESNTSGGFGITQVSRNPLPVDFMFCYQFGHGAKEN